MPEWMLQLFVIAASSGGVYGAIRADLAAIRTKVEQASVAANHAHRRIDDLLMMKKANEQ